jgi:hypothetical protein
VRRPARLDLSGRHGNEATASALGSIVFDLTMRELLPASSIIAMEAQLRSRQLRRL